MALEIICALLWFAFLWFAFSLSVYILENGLFQASANLTGWVNSVPETGRATFRRAAHVTSVNRGKICMEGENCWQNSLG